MYNLNAYLTKCNPGYIITRNGKNSVTFCENDTNGIHFTKRILTQCRSLSVMFYCKSDDGFFNFFLTHFRFERTHRKLRLIFAGPKRFLVQCQLLFNFKNFHKS